MLLVVGTNLLPYLGICQEGGVDDGESSNHLALVSRRPGSDTLNTALCGWLTEKWE